MESKHWIEPKGYRRIFAEDVPADAEGRRAYARDLLERFATRAFRRPVDDGTLNRLVALAEAVTHQDGETFEGGIAQAMAAILTSPRFLFREEGIEPGSKDRYPLVDEYALASRLSYFLWSSMPDEELFRLASEHQLRANLHAQVDRMLADDRSEEFIENFVGQWLQSRDIEGVNISASAVMSRDRAPDPDAERLRDRARELFRKPAESLTDAEKAELAAARASFVRSSDRYKQFRADRLAPPGDAGRDRDAVRLHRPG